MVPLFVGLSSPKTGPPFGTLTDARVNQLVSSGSIVEHPPPITLPRWRSQAWGSGCVVKLRIPLVPVTTTFSEQRARTIMRPPRAMNPGFFRPSYAHVQPLVEDAPSPFKPQCAEIPTLNGLSNAS